MLGLNQLRYPGSTQPHFLKSAERNFLLSNTACHSDGSSTITLLRELVPHLRLIGWNLCVR
jgi:hypothetical protein